MKNEHLQKIQACTTLSELEQLALSDQELRTDLEGTQLVFGDGNPNTSLMLVGEAPGKEEDLVGKPFVGRSGKLLTALIQEHVGLSRAELYITNIVKHRPPENRDPKAQERNYALPYLIRQIQLIAPLVILCVGRISAQSLMAKKWPLKAFRQQFFAFEGSLLTASYHPAALLRNPNWKPYFIEDLSIITKKLNEQSTHGH